jgi:hypothetical protein
MEYVRNAYRIAVGKLKGKMSLGESRCKIDDVIILKRILNKNNVDYCILLAVVRACSHGSKLSGSKK